MRLDIVFVVDECECLAVPGVVLPVTIWTFRINIKLQVAEWVWQDKLCGDQAMNNTECKSVSCADIGQSDELPAKHPGYRGVRQQYHDACFIFARGNDAIDNQEDEKGNETQEINPGN